MHPASAGQRESPVPLTNSKRKSAPLIRATSPGASVNRSFNGTVGPDGLFSSQPVTHRRHKRTTEARMASGLAKSVPSSEFVDEREGRTAIAKPFPKVEPEHTVEPWQCHPHATPHIDIVPATRFGLSLDMHGIHECGGADVNDRLQRPPLPHLA